MNENIVLMCLKIISVKNITNSEFSDWSYEENVLVGLVEWCV